MTAARTAPRALDAIRRACGELRALSDLDARDLDHAGRAAVAHALSDLDLDLESWRRETRGHDARAGELWRGGGGAA